MKLSTFLVAFITLSTSVLAAPAPADELKKRQSDPILEICIDMWYKNCERRTVRPGDCNNLYGKWQDSISSVRLVRGSKCILYWDGGCKRLEKVVTGDIQLLQGFNDVTTSFRCWN